MPPAKGYTEMKDSGIEWLGKIPNNWRTIRVKYAFRIKKEIAGELGHTVLSVTQRGIKPKDMSEKGQFSLDYSKYQLVSSGDFIMNHMDLLTGWVDISNMDGVTSPDYRVFQSSNPEKYYPDFYRYVFQTCYQQRIFYGLGQGVSGFGRWRLPAEIFLNFYLPVPPYEGQSAIAAYLDTQCAKIDEIIARAKASIEDYKQWKASVVDECISQALTSSPQVRLKFLMTYIVDCPHETPEYCLDGDYLVIRTADQDYGFLRPDDSMYRLNEAEFHKRSRRLPLEKNDIVYGREGERWGLACLVPESGKYCLGQRIMQFRCKVDRILPHYAMWALNSRHVYLQGIVDTLGSTSPHVNISTIRNYYIPIPPIPEQRRISTYLFERCGAIDAIIKSKQSLIDDLESYKKSLIYEVVTGKRRVC